MASSNTSSAATTTPIANPPPVSINATQQITTRLTPTNFPSWHTQFESLLLGYNLYGYVDGTLPCPSIDSPDAAPTAAYFHWFRQDKLILNAILTSVSDAVIPFIAASKTSSQAWNKLTKLYASRSRTRVMQLKEDLTLIQRGTRTVTDFLYSVKSIADELALIDNPLSADDITLYVLNGLGPEYREMMAPIRTCESSLSFEELHDLLVGHEAYLKRMDTHSPSLVVTAHNTQRKDPRFSKKPWSSQHVASPRYDNKYQPRYVRQPKYNPKCQYCDLLGHVAKYCPQLHTRKATANCTTATPNPDKRWLIDSAASHNITSKVSNLQLHSEYDGTDEVLIGDGTGLTITHSGSLTLPFPKRSFNLQDTLCVPSINQNLISVHHFTKHNNVFLELHPSCFFVKDQRTRETLLQGPCENGVYPLPKISSSHPIAMVHERTSINGWHQRLGHPSSKVVARMITSFSLPISSNSSNSHNCDSCSINKSHRLPFHKHGLNSSAPFDLIYTDVWGPSPQTSIQGHKYYVIFIDHFTKYV